MKLILLSFKQSLLVLRFNGMIVNMLIYCLSVSPVSYSTKFYLLTVYQNRRDVCILAKCSTRVL
jgi:hypothetical protein